jgi:hypothetical protein
MSHFEQHLSNHPILGLILSVCGIIFGSIIDTLGKLQGVHLPPFIIEIFQILSYCGAICIAVVTVHGWFKKTFRK